MSWRVVVVTEMAKLDYKVGYLVIRKKDTITRIHISEIGLLMIESTLSSCTAALLSELIKNKVNIIFCDEKHNPVSQLLSLYGSHDTSAKIRKQIHFSEDIKKQVWTEIVTEKIKQQKYILQWLNMHDSSDLLQLYIEELQFYDETNREGHAAKVYFNSLFGKSFTRSDENPINAALNYGYGIIVACFSREIVSQGYLTQLGIFHDNMFNQFNLSSDLMEPFRCLVDKKVILLQPKKFEHSEKMEILNLLNEEVIIDGKKQYIANAIKIYVRSVFEALNEEDISLIKFYKNEL
mgnify:CR=1 FL=1